MPLVTQDFTELNYNFRFEDLIKRLADHP